MDLVRDIIARHFEVHRGELVVGGIPVQRLAEDYGTPLFVYNAAILDRQLASLRSTYPSDFTIFYSMKANPCPAVVKHFVERGLGLEIASVGEFHQALRAGCAPEDILFAGPGKTESELEFVMERGIGEVHIESPLEARRVSTISERLGIRARVALRVNPGVEAQGGAMRMGGKATPFGVDEECMDPMVEQLAANPNVVFQGVHIFTATQVLDVEILVAQYRRGTEIAKRVADRIPFPLRTVDFGGGLGIPYFAKEQPLALPRLSEALSRLMDEVRRDSRFRETRWLIEPGRYLVGEAGVYVTRVNDIKTSRGKTFLVVDGGMNHHLAASGNLGQVIKRNFPAAILNRLDSAQAMTVDVAGPLCTPLDLLARELPIPTVQVGDLFGIFQSGAYARTASPLGFLSQPAPAEVLVRDGAATLVRRRGRLEDTLRDVP